MRKKRTETNNEQPPAWQPKRVSWAEYQEPLAANRAKEAARKAEAERQAHAELTDFAIKHLQRRRLSPYRLKRVMRYVVGRTYRHLVEKSLTDALEVTQLFRGQLVSIDGGK